MEHALRPVAVVGQQQQPLGVEIEATHWKQTLRPRAQLRWDEVEDRARRVSIADRARHAGRLGEHQVEAFLGRSDRAAVESELVTGGIYELADAGDDPIHRDAPVGDELL